MATHRGRGIASINYPIGMNLGGDPSQALVHSNPSGKFTVALSSIDLGQGMKSVTRQICAETLGVPVEDVYVDTADSATVNLPSGLEWTSAWLGSPPRFIPIG